MKPLRNYSYGSPLPPTLERAYVLIGEESLISDKFAQDLWHAWAKQSGGTLDKSTFWIENASDWAPVADALQQLSLFSLPRAFNIHCLQKTLAPAGKAFFEAIAPLEQGPFCLIRAPFFTSKLLASVKSTLSFVPCLPLSGGALVKFIDTRLREEGLQYDKDIPRFLANLYDTNALAIHQCILQLRLCAINPLTQETLQPLLSDVAHFPLLALTEACKSRDKARIGRVMKSLEDNLTEPLLVLWWITGLLRQLPHLQTATLFRLLQRCHTLDLQLKSGGCPVIWEALLQVVAGSIA